MKFQLKQQVMCTQQDGTKVIGVIAEYEEQDALVQDQSGNKHEEDLYVVMLHDEDAKMSFEEFLESELSPAIEESTLFDVVSRIAGALVNEDIQGKDMEAIRELILDKGFSE